MRFFWRIGSTPADSKFPQLNAAPVVPAAFPEWAATMDGWGGRLLGALTVVAQMAAVGLGLPVDALSSRMDAAPNLLAPTVSQGEWSRAGSGGRPHRAPSSADRPPTSLASAQRAPSSRATTTT